MHFFVFNKNYARQAFRFTKFECTPGKRQNTKQNSRTGPSTIHQQTDDSFPQLQHLYLAFCLLSPHSSTYRSLHAQVAVRLRTTTSDQIRNQDERNQSGQRAANGNRHNIRRIDRIAILLVGEMLAALRVERLELHVRHIQMGDHGGIVNGGQIQRLDARTIVRPIDVRLELWLHAVQLNGLVGCTRNGGWDGNHNR